MPVASPDVGRRPAAAGSLQVGDESVPGVVGGQGLLGRIDVGLDGVGQDRIQQRHAAGAGGASRPGVPYELSDPFILVHESRFRLSELSGMDTKHPDRGFDNLWYILEGSASTGHSTGPGGAIERARLPKGALLALRTGRGAWHAEAIGAEERGEGLGDSEWRSVLFWVNLARKDKQTEPSWSCWVPERSSRSPTPPPPPGSCS